MASQYWFADICLFLVVCYGEFMVLDDLKKKKKKKKELSLSLALLLLPIGIYLPQRNKHNNTAASQQFVP